MVSACHCLDSQPNNQSRGGGGGGIEDWQLGGHDFEDMRLGGFKTVDIFILSVYNNVEAT